MNKDQLRNLDKLIAEKVFNEEVLFLNQKGGFNVDYMVKNKNSKANEAIYAMDMVHDYRLKSFSQNNKYVFELIEIVNKKNLYIEISQLDEGKSWSVSSWKNNYEKDKSFKGNDLMSTLCLLTLSIYNYEDEQLMNQFGVQNAS